MMRIVTLIVVLALSACGPAGAPEPPWSSSTHQPAAVRKFPTLAFETDDGSTSIVHWIRGKQSQKISGVFRAIAPDGSIVVTENGRGKRLPAQMYYRAASGKSVNISNRYAPTDKIGFGDGLIITLGTSTSGTTMRAFDQRFKLTRTLSLPGKADDAGLGSVYSSPVGVGGSIFAVRSDGMTRAGSRSDVLVKLAADGKITESANNQHLRELAVGSDDRSLVAVAAQAPLGYRSVPEDKAVVTLDSVSGEIAETYGLPPSCKQLSHVTGDPTCIDRLDVVEGQVVVTTKGSGNAENADPRRADRSAWIRTKDGWAEVRRLRGRTVIWQGGGQLVQDGSVKNGPLSWSNGKTQRTIAPSVAADRWWAPGALLRP